MILLALAVLAANPSSLPSVIAGARPGDTIRLVAGSYPIVVIKSRTFIPPLTVDASAARLGGFWVTATTGVTLQGGEITGTIPADGVATGYGVIANGNSSAITVSGVHISNFKLGIGFDRVHGARITGNWLSYMSSDGIDVSLSRDVVIDHNVCTEFKPADAAHPDCIQLWSRPAVPPTSDVQITNNNALGRMQGISLFNHVRDGVDDGGFDRVVIRGNTVLNTYANGIAAYDCRGCTVRDNSVNSLPNYELRAQLIIARGSVVQCGNVVPMVLRQGSPPCAN